MKQECVADAGVFQNVKVGNITANILAADASHGIANGNLEAIGFHGIGFQLPAHVHWSDSTY